MTSNIVGAIISSSTVLLLAIVAGAWKIASTFSQLDVRITRIQTKLDDLVEGTKTYEKASRFQNGIK